MRKQILLRDYQQDAVIASDEMISSQRAGGGIVVLPTGSGKSLVAAQVMLNAFEKQGKRPLLLTHRKELIAQDEEAVKKLNPFVRTGVYCAGLGRKEPDADIVFATIGSVHRNPAVLGIRDVILIDEVHLANKASGTVYEKVLRGHYNSVPRIGLSASPFRMDSGLLTEGKDALFDEVLIQITARELIDSGYLSPLVGIGTDSGLIDTEGVHKRAGDFITSELEQAAMNDDLVQAACSEIIRLGEDRSCHLIFCVSVEHAKMVADEMNEKGWKTLAVWGNMPSSDREEAIDALKNGDARALTNVDVLTTGVDIPAIDCISILRPTMSKVRHIQSNGRGLRLHQNKQNCLILDFSGNCRRHGDIDDLGMDDFVDLKQERVDGERKKRARDAQSERETRRLGHNAYASNIDPMSGGGLKELKVYGVKYRVQESRRDYTRKDLIVTYETDAGRVNKWLCVEHKKAKHFADRWFALRGIPKKDVPYSAYKARDLAQGLEIPVSISTAVNAKGFQDILVEHFEDTGGNGGESFD